MKRTKHSLSHYRLFTTKMGQLTPAGWVEVLPGDTIQMSTSCLMRCAPMVTPPMHPLVVRLHTFFVPLRLIWSNFTQFITGGALGTDATVLPTIALTAPAVGSLADYLGVPTGSNLTVSALPFRAYNLIFNEFYRDQDLVTALVNSLADGVDSTSNTSLQNVAWEKDFFTTSRPWTDKGNPVSLPLGNSAPVKAFDQVTGIAVLRPGDASPNTSLIAASSSQTVATASATGSTQRILTLDNTKAGVAGGLFADLSVATAATINTIRHAFALQQYQEARALYGSRYTEYLRFLGITGSDARLQRPEYVTGGKAHTQFSEVLQTGVDTSGTPTTGVGKLVGHGIAALRGHRGRRFFEEHGILMALFSALPKTMYATGLPKYWSYATREDFWQRELQHIGQQAVLNQEIYNAQVGGGGLTGIFGYQDRYDQYRRVESGVSGLFRSTLNTWHMARLFTADVALNSTFVQSNPSSRIFQDTASDHLYVMANHSIQARRLVDPKGVPGMVKL